MCRVEIEVERVIIDTYLDPAFYLSIILPHDKEREWYNSHFLNIHGRVFNENGNNYLKVSYNSTNREEYGDVLEISKLSCGEYEINNFVSFLSDKLSNSNCMIIDMDLYNIEGTPFYDKEHYYHPILIYGNEKGKFQFTGLTANFKYGKIDMTEHCLKQGAITAYNDQIRDKKESMFVNIVRVKDNFLNFNNDTIVKITNSLRMMYESATDDIKKNDINGDSIDIFYGLDVYKNVIENINLSLVKENSYLDYRIFHFLWKFSLKISESIEFLYEKLNCKIESKIEDKLLVFRNESSNLLKTYMKLGYYVQKRANFKMCEEIIYKLQSKTSKCLSLIDGIICDVLSNFERCKNGKNKI